jgi:hypothetical protein
MIRHLTLADAQIALAVKIASKLELAPTRTTVLRLLDNSLNLSVLILWFLHLLLLQSPLLSLRQLLRRLLLLQSLLQLLFQARSLFLLQ